MKISKDYILKEVAGNIVVVPVGEKSVNFNAIVHLNGVGAFIFEALQKEELTLEELIEKVCAEYEVEKEVATKDVTVFCENLKKNKILD